MRKRTFLSAVLVAIMTSACAPAMPADHGDRTECLVCHLEGADDAPMVPLDHRQLRDGPAVCGECHAAA